MLRVIALLEGELMSQSQISGRLKQISLKNVPVFSTIHHSFNSDQFPSPCWWKTAPLLDAATMLHCGDSVLGWWGVEFAPDIAFSLMDKKLKVSLIWPEYLLPHAWGVSHMPFGKHQTCLLICFFKLWLFSGHSFFLATLNHSSVECTAWSYGQILQSPLWSFAPSGLSLVSC